MCHKLIKLLFNSNRYIDIVTHERDGWADCIHLLLKKKAFDKVPHRLLCMLEQFGGLKGTLKNWMEDYPKEGK